MRFITKNDEIPYIIIRLTAYFGFLHVELILSTLSIVLCVLLRTALSTIAYLWTCGTICGTKSMEKADKTNNLIDFNKFGAESPRGYQTLRRCRFARMIPGSDFLLSD